MNSYLDSHIQNHNDWQLQSNSDKLNRKKNKDKSKRANEGLSESSGVENPLKKARKSKKDKEGRNRKENEHSGKERKSRKEKQSRKEKRKESDITNEDKTRKNRKTKESKQKKQTSSNHLDSELFNDVDFTGMDAFSLGDDPYKLKSSISTKNSKSSWLSRVKVKPDVESNNTSSLDRVSNLSKNAQPSQPSNRATSQISGAEILVTTTSAPSALELASKMMNRDKPTYASALKRGTETKRKRVQKSTNLTLEDYLNDSNSDIQSQESYNSARFRQQSKNPPVDKDVEPTSRTKKARPNSAQRRQTATDAKISSPTSINSSNLEFYMIDDLSDNSSIANASNKPVHKKQSDSSSIVTELMKQKNTAMVTSNIRRIEPDSDLDDELMYFLESKSDHSMNSKSTSNHSLHPVASLKPEHIPKESYIDTEYTSYPPKKVIEEPKATISYLDRTPNQPEGLKTGEQSELNPFKYAYNGASSIADDEDIEEVVDIDDIQSEHIQMASMLSDSMSGYSLPVSDVASETIKHDISEQVNETFHWTNNEASIKKDKVASKSSPIQLSNLTFAEDLSFDDNISLESSHMKDQVPIESLEVQNVNHRKNSSDYIESSKLMKKTHADAFEDEFMDLSFEDLDFDADDDFQLDEYEQSFDFEDTPTKKSIHSNMNTLKESFQAKEEHDLRIEKSHAIINEKMIENINATKMNIVETEHQKISPQVLPIQNVQLTKAQEIQTASIEADSSEISKSIPKTIETQTPFQAYHSYMPLGNGNFVASTSSLLGQVIGQEYLQKKAGMQPTLMAQNEMFKQQLEMLRLKMVESKLQFLNSVGIDPPFRVIKEAWGEPSKMNNAEIDSHDSSTMKTNSEHKENLSMDELIYNHLVEQRQELQIKRTTRRYTTLEDTKAYMEFRRRAQYQR